MNKAYNFRLYPTKEQEVLLAKTFGCVRFVYNKMLEERIELYEQFKDDKAELKKHKSPTPAKYKSEYVWLKEVDSLALANAQMNLQTAYNTEKYQVIKLSSLVLYLNHLLATIS